MILYSGCKSRQLVKPFFESYACIQSGTEPRGSIFAGCVGSGRGRDWVDDLYKHQRQYIRDVVRRETEDMERRREEMRVWSLGGGGGVGDGVDREVLEEVVVDLGVEGRGRVVRRKRKRKEEGRGRGSVVRRKRRERGRSSGGIGSLVALSLYSETGFETGTEKDDSDEELGELVRLFGGL